MNTLIYLAAVVAEGTAIGAIFGAAVIGFALTLGALLLLAFVLAALAKPGAAA